MARRIENPKVDDIGYAGLELTPAEFEQFLEHLFQLGGDAQSLDDAYDNGFIPGLQRSDATDVVFRWLQLPPDVNRVAVVREGARDAMENWFLDTAAKLFGNRGQGQAKPSDA